jgi:hypothetical protein
VRTFVDVVAFPHILEVDYEPMFEEVDSSGHSLEDWELDYCLATQHCLHRRLEPARLVNELLNGAVFTFRTYRGTERWG